MARSAKRDYSAVASLKHDTRVRTRESQYWRHTVGLGYVYRNYHCKRKQPGSHRIRGFVKSYPRIGQRRIACDK